MRISDWSSDVCSSDLPELRAATGDAFAGERSPSDIAGTQHNMLGPKGLDASRFPDVRVHSTAIAGDWPMLVATIEITRHGVTRAMTVPLTVDRQSVVSGKTGSVRVESGGRRNH